MGSFYESYPKFGFPISSPINVDPIPILSHAGWDGIDSIPRNPVPFETLKQNLEFRPDHTSLRDKILNQITKL